MFENHLIEGIYISRFVASWINKGGKLDFTFKEWLGTLVINERKLTNDEIKDIYNFATNGKLELEISALKFLNK